MYLFNRIASWCQLHQHFMSTFLYKIVLYSFSVITIRVFLSNGNCDKSCCLNVDEIGHRFPLLFKVVINKHYLTDELQFQSNPNQKLF